MQHKNIIVPMLSLLLLVFVQLTPFSASAITWPSGDIPLIENDPGRDINPSVTQTTDGKIWVVYSTSQYQPKGDIYYVTYDGSLWSTQQRLTTDTDKDDKPSVMQAQDGTIWVVWMSDREVDENILYKTSSNNGASWSYTSYVTVDPSPDRSPSITQSADGKIWVFWESRRTGNFEIFCKTYDGASWSTPFQLTNDNSTDSNPSGVGTWDGKVWLVWRSMRTGNYELFYKIYDGSSWSPNATQLTFDPDNDGKPSITQARDGSIWVTWPTDRNGNQFELYYNKTTDYGATWFAERITQSSKDDTTPSIYNTQDGKMWVVWSRFVTGSNSDIYYKTSDPILVHDVAITSVTSAPILLPPVYQGDIIQVNVTAENQGTQSETFSVTCYANSTQIGNIQTISLDAETSTKLTFNWNTTDFKRGNYIISASASVVPDEYLPHQADNTLTGGTERVLMLGDVNDDGRVNIIDLATIGKAYGTEVGDERYNQDADINHDDLINIIDLATAARNYGKTG